MWLSFALASSLLLAVRRVYEKKLAADFGNFSLSFVSLVFSLPFVLVLFLFFPIPSTIFALSWHFWWPLLFIWVVLYPIQNYLLYRSLREGELSHVTPVGALLPVFNIATSYALIGEIPTMVGLLGIVLTVIATYLLLVDTRGAHVFNKPVLFMIGTTVCTAIGSTLDKIAIEASTPVYYTFVNLLGASVLFLGLTYFYGEAGDLKKIGKHAPTFTILGVVFALAFASFASAFLLGPTSYTLAIRSAGFMLAAIWGILALRESVSSKKIAAIALFTLGTVMLAFAA